MKRLILEMGMGADLYGEFIPKQLAVPSMMLSVIAL